MSTSPPNLIISSVAFVGAAFLTESEQSAAAHLQTQHSLVLEVSPCGCVGVQEQHVFGFNPVSE